MFNSCRGHERNACKHGASEQQGGADEDRLDIMTQ